MNNKNCEKCGEPLETRKFFPGNSTSPEKWTICPGCNQQHSYHTIQAEIKEPQGKYEYEIRITLIDSDGGILAVEKFNERADNREDIDEEGLAEAMAGELALDLFEDDLDYESKLIDVVGIY